MTIRVLIADDHLVVREGLRTILEIQDDIEVAGEASDGAEAVRLALELRPDVTLMDLRMPHMDGLTAIRELHRSWPEAAVVILTTYDEDDYIVKGLQAGARGYLLKDAGRESLLAAIRSAARGETLLTPSVAARVAAHLEEQPGAAPGPPSGAPAMVLSDREYEVLALVAEGLANKEIADRLDITERTVKAHVTSILNKLAVNSRAAAIAKALQSGLLPGPHQG